MTHTYYIRCEHVRSLKLFKLLNSHFASLGRSHPNTNFTPCDVAFYIKPKRVIFNLHKRIATPDNYYRKRQEFHSEQDNNYQI